MTTWYYAVDQDRRGPMDEAEITGMIARGEINEDTLVWREGLSDWEAASAHFSFSASAPNPTPPIPPVAPAAPDWRAAPEPGDPGNAGVGPDGLYVGAPSRTFAEAISVCFSKYVRFSGRASRSEYWFFVLFLFLLGIVTAVLDAIIFPGSLEEGGPINGIASLATFLPSLAVTWRRLHDTDRSGWWVGGFYLGLTAVAVVTFAIFGGIAGAAPDSLIAIIAILGVGILIYLVILLVFLCQKGTMGPNRFG